MKELLKKVFDKKIATPIFVGFGTFAIFTFIVFPGLTEANTILNIIAALVGIFTLVFVFYYLKADEVYDSITVEQGETELDYIPKGEIVKKKPAKKKATKPEFPMPPHHAKKETPIKNKKK